MIVDLQYHRLPVLAFSACLPRRKKGPMTQIESSCPGGEAGRALLHASNVEL